MFTDGVKCSKLTHLKHFNLNAAKSSLRVSQILVKSTEAWRRISHLGKALPFLALPKIWLWTDNHGL